MLTKFKHILLGTYYNLLNKKQDIAYPRLMICSKCKYNKISIGFGNYCNLCGCILKSKTTIGEERCPAGKW